MCNWQGLSYTVSELLSPCYSFGAILKYTIRKIKITNEDLGIFARFRFRNGKANEFPQILFRICFRIQHARHAQATTARHTHQKSKIPKVFFQDKIPNPRIFSNMLVVCNSLCCNGSTRFAAYRRSYRATSIW